MRGSHKILMEINQPVEAAPSADFGNIPVDAPNQPVQPQSQEPGTPTPDGNVAPKDVASAPQEPATQQPATPTAAPAVELFETPDGRKVDAATLSREWKENFMPDYTRKSQALAQQQAPAQTPPVQQQPLTNINNSVDPFSNPDYIPQSWAEVMEHAKNSAIREIDARNQAEAQRVQQIEQLVTSQLTELKTADPSLNETSLFQHATKFGFQDLKLAYANMKAMNDIAKTAQQQTQQNIQRRANEPIATQPGQANGTLPNPRGFSAARDYLRSINK